MALRDSFFDKCSKACPSSGKLYTVVLNLSPVVRSKIILSPDPPDSGEHLSQFLIEISEVIFFHLKSTFGPLCAGENGFQLFILRQIEELLLDIFVR